MAGEKANTKQFQQSNPSSSVFRRRIFGHWCDCIPKVARSQDTTTDSAVVNDDLPAEACAVLGSSRLLTPALFSFEEERENYFVGREPRAERISFRLLGYYLSGFQPCESASISG
jgi:hypothetical protein